MNTVELINTLRNRTAMYIGKHSIFCFRAFINGWHFRNTEEDVNIEVLNDFCLWLQKYYNIDDNRSWDELLFLTFKNEKDALDNFFILFDKFIACSDENSKTDYS